MQSAGEQADARIAAGKVSHIKTQAQAGEDPSALMRQLLRSEVDRLTLEEHDEVVGILLEKVLAKENRQGPLSETEVALIADCLFWLADHTLAEGSGDLPRTSWALINAPEQPAEEEDKVWRAALELPGELPGEGAERFPLYEKTILAAGTERGSARAAARLAVPAHSDGLSFRGLAAKRQTITGSLMGLSPKERKIAGGIAGAFTSNPGQLADTAVEVAKDTEKRGTQL